MTASVSPRGEECISLSSLFPHSLILHSSPISREKGDGKLKMEPERDNFGLFSLPHSNREIFSPPCPLSGKKNKENCNSAVLFCGEIRGLFWRKKEVLFSADLFPFPYLWLPLSRRQAKKSPGNTRLLATLGRESLSNAALPASQEKSPLFLTPLHAPTAEGGKAAAAEVVGTKREMGWWAFFSPSPPPRSVVLQGGGGEKARKNKGRQFQDL